MLQPLLARLAEYYEKRINGGKTDRDLIGTIIRSDGPILVLGKGDDSFRIVLSDVKKASDKIRFNVASDDGHRKRTNFLRLYEKPQKKAA